MPILSSFIVGSFTEEKKYPEIKENQEIETLKEQLRIKDE